ncbi:MAG: DUF998 domain-containing protein [Promethearchaeota archaeon]
MKNFNRFFDRLFKLAPGGVYALISISIGILFLTISIFLFPDYKIGQDYISLLGIGPGFSSIFFNIGLILAGIFILPFFVYLGRILNEPVNNNKRKMISYKISILGCISLSLIGCFPAINLIMLIIHGIFAAFFFICILIYVLIFSHLILNDNRFPKHISYIGFLSAPIFAAFIATQLPLLEWISTFILVLWIFELSLCTLYKKL